METKNTKEDSQQYTLPSLIKNYEDIVKSTGRDILAARSEAAKKIQAQRLHFFEATLKHLKELEELRPKPNDLMPAELKEAQLRELGFSLHMEYPHDQYVTREFRNGEMMVSFTYESDSLVYKALDVEDMNIENITPVEMSIIIPILAKEQ